MLMTSSCWPLKRQNYRSWGKGRRVGREGIRGEVSNYFIYAPVSDCMGRPITYRYSYTYVPVGTVISDTNSHEAN